MRESDRLGLTLALNACDGWATASGPWITPELSMQEICFTQTPAAVPGKVHIALPRPTVDPHANMPFPIYNADNNRVEKPEIPARKTYYRDIAVLALPATGVIPKDKVVDLTNRTAGHGGPHR